MLCRHFEKIEKYLALASGSLCMTVSKAKSVLHSVKNSKMSFLNKHA